MSFKETKFYRFPSTLVYADVSALTDKQRRELKANEKLTDYPKICKLCRMAWDDVDKNGYCGLCVSVYT